MSGPQVTQPIGRGTALAAARWALCLVAFLAATGGAGCGPRPVRRYAVSGTVTFGGQPVPRGSVSFDPVRPEAAGPGGPRAVGGGFAHIVAGRFDTAAGGRGHVGGTHRVIVVGLAGGGDSSGDEAADFYAPPPLFPAYEIKLDLPYENNQLEIQVPTHGANQNRRTKTVALHGREKPSD
jgi:hypothetical protein